MRSDQSPDKNSDKKQLQQVAPVFLQQYVKRYIAAVTYVLIDNQLCVLSGYRPSEALLWTGKVFSLLIGLDCEVGTCTVFFFSNL